jgi:hypothetical protein
MLAGFCWGNLKEEDHLEQLGIDDRIILKLTLMKYYRRMWTESTAYNRNK